MYCQYNPERKVKSSLTIKQISKILFCFFFFFVWKKELMRELDQKEEVIKSVQEIAEQLLLENHPARLTIEVS